jgi:putative transposase
MPNESQNCSPPGSVTLSSEALYRFQVVSAVRARVLGGDTLAGVVRALVQNPPVPLCGLVRRPLSARSVYRWYKGYQESGLSALERRTPRVQQRISRVLPEPLLDFFRAEKALDRYASVPELLRRAQERGVLGEKDSIDRVSAWRACRRMDLPLRRLPKKQESDQRRFAYPHRMMMVLADGKHFRAGIGRTRRVALFFLDDATRLGLHVVVGTAEEAPLFLRGLYEVIARYGFFDVLYLDNGPGFRADDTAAACAKLGIHLVLGTSGYPEGHGKVERFNETAQAQVLRGLSGAAEVSDNCGSLELRLSHYLHQRYNRQPHEAHDGDTPLERFEADTRALRFPESMAALHERFVVTETRKVSRDNVLPFQGTDYEVPRGHAGTVVTVHRRLLSDQVFILHDGQKVTLHPVDLAQNAIERRARPQSPSPSDDEGTPVTAARLAFERDFGPIVGIDGGFVKNPALKGDRP